MEKMNYEDLRDKALEMLNEDDELFITMVEELDSWNGFADGFRCYPMYEIDELFYGVKIGDFLDKLTSSFNHRDNYFIDTIYGLDSTDDPAEVYRDHTDAGDVLDNVLDYYGKIYINDPDFEEVIHALVFYEEDESEVA